ncbi:MAG: hypothetical protein IKZ46_12110 [Victivallales bacterium]|nr:hypothetical protein [Victivallales bacterium]
MKMKEFKSFVWLTALAVITTCLHAENVLTPEQIETLADRCVTAIVQKELDLRELAAELKFDWPVAPPAYTFTDHQERAMAQAMAAAKEKYPDSLVEEAKAEAEKRYSVLKVGDNAKLTSNRQPVRVYEGRIHAITDQFIRIGLTGNISTKDLDVDTLARFSEERSKERKAWFVKQASERMEINRQTMVEELMPEIMEKSLLADGYAPINKEKKKLKVYLGQGNWVNKSAVLQEKAMALKAEMYKDKISEARENLYGSFGYEYDRMMGRWRLTNHVHDLPLSGGVTLKRSLWAKLKGR